jgi:hypothetical protein
VTRLDDRERRISLWAAGFGALSAVVFYAPYVRFLAAWVLASIGLAMSGLLALAARRRSRLLTSLAAVLLGFGPWGFAYIVGLPYMVLAGWLTYRGAKMRTAMAEAASRRPVRDREPEDEAVEATAKEEPAKEKPAKEPRAKDKPVKDPAAEKPAEEKPAEEKPTQEKPTRERRFRVRAARGKKPAKPAPGKPAGRVANKRYTPPGGRR